MSAMLEQTQLPLPSLSTVYWKKFQYNEIYSNMNNELKIIFFKIVFLSTHPLYSILFLLISAKYSNFIIENYFQFIKQWKSLTIFGLANSVVESDFHHPIFQKKPLFKNYRDVFQTFFNLALTHLD